MLRGTDFEGCEEVELPEIVRERCNDLVLDIPVRLRQSIDID